MTAPEEIDPVNIVIALQPGRAPAQAYAAKLLARTVEHLKVAESHAQQLLVPYAAERIAVTVDDVAGAALSPSTATKLVDAITRDLHVLVAEVNADARGVLRQRLETDLAVTLIPRLDGGVTS